MNRLELDASFGDPNREANKRANGLGERVRTVVDGGGAAEGKKCEDKSAINDSATSRIGRRNARRSFGSPRPPHAPAGAP